MNPSSLVAILHNLNSSNWRNAVEALRGLRSGMVFSGVVVIDVPEGYPVDQRNAKGADAVTYVQSFIALASEFGWAVIAMQSGMSFTKSYALTWLQLASLFRGQCSTEDSEGAVTYDDDQLTSLCEAKAVTIACHASSIPVLARDYSVRSSIARLLVKPSSIDDVVMRKGSVGMHPYAIVDGLQGHHILRADHLRDRV